VLCIIVDYVKYKEKTMLRTIRIIAGTPLYLLASMLLMFSLKIYPKDIRQEARDSFM
jgi:hypothetical protein